MVVLVVVHQLTLLLTVAAYQDKVIAVAVVKHQDLAMVAAAVAEAE
jgi:hypothetical protein